MVPVIRLCLLSASRSLERAVDAATGKEGCVLLLKDVEKLTKDVVGRLNGKGIMLDYM